MIHLHITHINVEGRTFCNTCLTAVLFCFFEPTKLPDFLNFADLLIVFFFILHNLKKIFLSTPANLNFFEPVKKIRPHGADSKYLIDLVSIVETKFKFHRIPIALA